MDAEDFGKWDVLPMSLQLRPFFEYIQPQMIFRIFYFEGELVAATQQSPWCFYPDISENRDLILSTIKSFAATAAMRSLIRAIFTRAKEHSKPKLTSSFGPNQPLPAIGKGNANTAPTVRLVGDVGGVIALCAPPQSFVFGDEQYMVFPEISTKKGIGPFSHYSDEEMVEQSEKFKFLKQIPEFNKKLRMSQQRIYKKAQQEEAMRKKKALYADDDDDDDDDEENKGKKTEAASDLYSSMASRSSMISSSSAMSSSFRSTSTYFTVEFPENDLKGADLYQAFKEGNKAVEAANAGSLPRSSFIKAPSKPTDSNNSTNASSFYTNTLKDCWSSTNISIASRISQPSSHPEEEVEIPLPPLANYDLLAVEICIDLRKVLKEEKKDKKKTGGRLERVDKNKKKKKDKKIATLPCQLHAINGIFSTSNDRPPPNLDFGLLDYSFFRGLYKHLLDKNQVGVLFHSDPMKIVNNSRERLWSHLDQTSGVTYNKAVLPSGRGDFCFTILGCPPSKEFLDEELSRKIKGWCKF